MGVRKVYYFLETDGEHELYFDEHGDFYLCDGEDGRLLDLQAAGAEIYRGASRWGKRKGP